MVVAVNPAAARVREAMRQRVDGERILERIEFCTQVLLSGWEPVTDPVSQTVTFVALSKERASALGKVMDIQLRLLAKVLPDLKAVELSGPDGEPLKVGGQDRMVLATKLLAVMRSGEGGTVDTAQPDVIPWLQ